MPPQCLFRKTCWFTVTVCMILSTNKITPQSSLSWWGASNLALEAMNTPVPPSWTTPTRNESFSAEWMSREMRGGKWDSVTKRYRIFSFIHSFMTSMLHLVIKETAFLSIHDPRPALHDDKMKGIYSISHQTFHACKFQPEHFKNPQFMLIPNGTFLAQLTQPPLKGKLHVSRRTITIFLWSAKITAELAVRISRYRVTF